MFEKEKNQSHENVWRKVEGKENPFYLPLHIDQAYTH